MVLKSNALIIIFFLRYDAKPKIRNASKRQRELLKIEGKIAVLQLKKAKLEEEERVSSAEQESVLESDSELADHDGSLVLPMLTRAIRRRIIIMRSTRDLRSMKAPIQIALIVNLTHLAILRSGLFATRDNLLIFCK